MNFAKKRLIRDLHEVKGNPVPGVWVTPLDEDLFTWHLLLQPSGGCLEDHTFHGVLKFPISYPSSPPELFLSTQIPHPNVFAEEKVFRLCLDMLDPGTRSVKYHGWSSAYTAHSVLLQLQSFMLDEGAINKRKAAMARKAASGFHCADCSDLLDEIAKAKEKKQEDEKEKEKENSQEKKLGIVKARVCAWDWLPEDLSRMIFDYVLPSDLTALNSRQVMCFHRKVGIEDAKTVLGVGFNFNYFPQKPNSRRSNVVYQIRPIFDTLSAAAFFDDNVRVGVWKDKFTNFLPLIINVKHGIRSLPLIEQAMHTTMCGGDKAKVLTAELILEFITKAMSTVVVDLMQTSEKGEIKSSNSEKTLEGYVALHHMLIAFAIRYPSILKMVNDKVDRFVESKKHRTKAFTPNLGEFIVMLLLAKRSWVEVGPKLLEESFVRHARWMLQQYPALSFLESSAVSCVRMRQTFQSSLTSMRLISFHVCFMTMLRGLGAIDSDYHLMNYAKHVFVKYNQRYGKPIAQQVAQLQGWCKRILQLDDFSEFYRLCGLKYEGDRNLCGRLRNCVVESAKRGYHVAAKQKFEAHELIHLAEKNCLCSGMLRDNRSADLVGGGAFDLVFCLDCTGSMGGYIASAQKNIQEIASVIKGHQYESVHFGMVAYRDHPPQDLSFVTKVFQMSPSLSEFSKFLNSLTANGGGDCPEAFTAALFDTMKMRWRPNATKVIVTITDAPPHGLGYEYDGLPDGDPDGKDPIEIARLLANRGVTMYCVGCEPDISYVANTRAFFQGLSRITGGQYLALMHAGLLTKVIEGMTMEEKSLESVLDEVEAAEMKVKKRNKEVSMDVLAGRVQQILEAKKIEAFHMRVDVLSSEKMNKLNELRAELVCSASSLPHAVALLCDTEKAYKKELNAVLEKKQHLSGEQEPITLIQTLRCLKKLEQKRKESELLKRGCRYNPMSMQEQKQNQQQQQQKEEEKAQAAESKKCEKKEKIKAFHICTCQWIDKLKKKKPCGEDCKLLAKTMIKAKSLLEIQEEERKKPIEAKIEEEEEEGVKAEQQMKEAEVDKVRVDMLEGVVSYFNEQKGFGFIKLSRRGWKAGAKGEEVFFHYNDLLASTYLWDSLVQKKLTSYQKENKRTVIDTALIIGAEVKFTVEKWVNKAKQMKSKARNIEVVGVKVHGGRVVSVDAMKEEGSLNIEGRIVKFQFKNVLKQGQLRFVRRGDAATCQIVGDSALNVSFKLCLM